MGVQGIKLITGEEIVTEVMNIHHQNGRMIIKNPMVLKMTARRVNFVPWTFSTKGEIYLENRSIMARYIVSEDVEKIYTESVANLNTDDSTQILKG